MKKDERSILVGGFDPDRDLNDGNQGFQLTPVAEDNPIIEIGDALGLHGNDQRSICCR